MKVSDYVVDKMMNDEYFKAWDSDKEKAKVQASVIYVLLLPLILIFHAWTVSVICRDLVPFVFPGIDLNLSMLQCFVLFFIIDIFLMQILNWNSEYVEDYREKAARVIAGFGSASSGLLITYVMSWIVWLVG